MEIWAQEILAFWHCQTFHRSTYREYILRMACSWTRDLPVRRISAEGSQENPVAGNRRTCRRGTLKMPQMCTKLFCGEYITQLLLKWDFAASVALYSTPLTAHLGHDRSQIAQVASLKPDNFEPKIIKKTSDYLYAEYQSPTFGFIDDVEFFFTGNNRVEYRSASRIGESDGNINRKRIKALRQVRSCFACMCTPF